MAFDPVLQVPDFSRPENVRKRRPGRRRGRERRRHRAHEQVHGHLVAALGRAARRRRPPRAGRERRRVLRLRLSRPTIRSTRWARSPAPSSSSARRWARSASASAPTTARICYPPVATTALGAIPGGLLDVRAHRPDPEGAGRVPRRAWSSRRDSMEIFRPTWDGNDMRLDAAYQSACPSSSRAARRSSPAICLAR